MSMWRMIAASVLPVLSILFGAAVPAIAQPDYSGDVDGDGDVDLSDLAALLAAYLTCVGDPGHNPAADFNDDGCIDLADLATLLANYGSCLAPDMLPVPVGEFEMGDPWSEGDSDELPVHTVYLSPYYIGTYEVTNQQYCDGLNWAWAQGGLITVADWGVVYQYGSGTSYSYCSTDYYYSEIRIHWDGTTFTVTAGKEDHPMTDVSWYGAVAYCNWRSAMEGESQCYDLSTWTCDFSANGYRLPTEAEWEKAAGWDPAQQYHFRFGEHTDGCGFNCLDGPRANYWASGDTCETGDYPWTTPVGYYNGTNHDGYQTQNARSYYGCYDMSGNVYEWCHDRYDADYYDNSPDTDPNGPDCGVYCVLRGGSWGYYPHFCRSADRNKGTPGVRNDGIGFRVATGAP
jgi:sulfatase modifying factor 1